LADDHTIVRRAMRHLIELDPGCMVCAEAADGAEAVRLAELLAPTVAMLDIRMPEMDGFTAAARIRTRSPSTAVAMLSLHHTGGMVRRALAAGARGYILKSDAVEHLVPAVLTLSQSDRPYFTPQLTCSIWNEYQSRRE